MPIDFKAKSPTSLREAIFTIVAGLNNEERAAIREHGATMFHHGVGTAIRNEWGLWNGSELKDHFVETYGLGHADDMSGLILEGVDRAVKGIDYTDEDIQKEVDRCKLHWKKHGLDPLSA